MDYDQRVLAKRAYKKKLIALKERALEGLPQDVLSAIDLLKSRNFISSDYDPKIQYLVLRGFPFSITTRLFKDIEDEDDIEDKAFERPYDAMGLRTSDEISFLPQK